MASFTQFTRASLRAFPARAASAGIGALIAGLAGCQTQKDLDYEPVIAQFFVETAPADPTAKVVQLPQSGVQIPVSPRVVLSEGDVANVELVRVDLGLCLMFEFGADAARGLLRVSGSNLGRRLVVTLNGTAFGARLIDGVIADGRLMMFVELPDDELTETAVNLKKTSRDVQEALAKGKK